MKAVELYQSGKWSEEKLFVWAVAGTLPVINPQTGLHYSLKEKKDILLQRIELRLGYDWKKRWENGFVSETDRIKASEYQTSWLESGF